MSKLLLSILLSVAAFSANADNDVHVSPKATFSPVGFYNGTSETVNIRIGGSEYLIESGQSANNPGVLAERLIVTSTDGSPIPSQQIRLEATGFCPQPICLTIY